MSSKIRVGIVEDQALFREGMKAILNSWSEMEVVFESAEGYTVIDKLLESVALPDVILVDLSLPPHGHREFSGIHVTQSVNEQFPDIKILILSVHNDENFIVQLIENGAHGYLIKDCNPNEVREAVNSVFHKGSYINQQTLWALQKKSGSKINPKGNKIVNTQLTKREIEILSLICEQLTTNEIAERLFISSKTVNGHRNNLLQKTGSRNTAGLVVFAFKNSLLDDGH